MTNTMLTRLSAAALRSFHEAGHWGEDTIYALARRAADRSPDRIAVQERGRAIDYRALVAAADRLAAALLRGGARAGQRVAVWLPSRIETAVALLACSRNGYVCCPSLHRDHTVGEVAELLERMRAVALIAETGYGADADRADVFAAAERLDSMRLLVRLDPAGDRDAAVLGALPEAGDDAGDVRTDPDTVVYLAFTSGTTGTPKGVLHSDNTLLAPVRAMAADWSMDENMRIYTLSPLSHNLGFGAMVTALTGGGTLVVHDLPRGASLADRLADTAATFAFGVPTHAIDLLAELADRPSMRLPALTGFRISGAAVPPVVAQGLLEFGIVAQSGYGMTEAGSHNYTLPGDDPALIADSSGRTCAGYEVAVFARDDPDRPLPAGEIGQLGGRGAGLMLGYFDDQLATEAAFNSSGWFMTGDLGWLDDAGYLRITGRKKDLIIRGGHNIYPARIENLAMRHELVDKAAVIAVPDERLGEKVCLVVKPVAGRAPEAAEILDHLDAAGLSKFDMPEYYLVLDEIPLMPSGKILKSRLREWLDDGSVTPVPVRFTPRKGTPTCAR